MTAVERDGALQRCAELEEQLHALQAEIGSLHQVVIGTRKVGGVGG